MQTPTRLANGPRTPTDWHQVNWNQVNRQVRNLRYRIFRATRQNDWRRVRSLQKLMLRSYANRLLSVRRVSQHNSGRHTAGIDKVIVKSAAARGALVDQLGDYQPWRVRPVRRIYIPKANGTLRPLGIPCLIDRAHQAMVKNALEPEWEAQFEGSSYGFRPGRGAHDALVKLYLLCCPNKRKKWIVDADIQGCFDHISHDFLMRAIGHFPARELVRQWLKVGYVEAEQWHPTEAGTPQGGVISPLLMNIALHGMEAALGVKHNRRGEIRSQRAVVRYADDFVILCESPEDAQAAQTTLRDWLAERGLALSEEKTRIVHLQQGFDFLGCTIRHYRCPLTSRSGWKLLIKPSQRSIARLRQQLKRLWQQMPSLPLRVGIQRLNQLIRGWANYFRPFVSSEVFHRLDHWMLWRQWRYVKRQHPNHSKRWCYHAYWGHWSAEHPDTDVFGDKTSNTYVLRFTGFSIQRHILVKGKASMDDPDLKEYWQRRQAKLKANHKPSHQRIATQQRERCPVCNQSLFNGEALEVHHKQPKAQGGKDTYDNLVLLHLLCHQQVHHSSF